MTKHMGFGRNILGYTMYDKVGRCSEEYPWPPQLRPSPSPQSFSMICDEIGTSPSNAIRMFVSAFNRRGGFPFDPSNPYGFSQETLAAMDDAVTGRNLSGPYHTVKEAMAALDGE